MIHLEKLGFLLLIVIGAVVYAAGRDNPHLRRAREWALSQLWFMIALLLVCAALVVGMVLVAIAASTDVAFAERALVRHLNTPIFVKIPLALLCGALLVELASVVRRQQSTPLYLAVRAVPFAFFFIIGFFSYELQQTFRYLTRVEAVGITLDFTTASSEQPQSLLQDPTLGGLRNADTPFQLGIDLLPEAFDRVTADHSRVSDWCNAFDALDCGNLRRLQTSLDQVEEHLDVERDTEKLRALEATRAKLQQEVEAAKASANHLDLLFQATAEYMQRLQPLRRCLEGVYVGYFPNGSPIQDELSEFAAIAAVDYPGDSSGKLASKRKIVPRELKSGEVGVAWPEDAAQPADPAAADSHFGNPSRDSPLRRHLVELRGKLVRFGHYVEQYSTAPTRGLELRPEQHGANSTKECRELEHSLSDDKIERLVATRDKLKQLRAAAPATPADNRKQTEGAVDSGAASGPVPSPAFRRHSLPHESIFEAAIIAASGYPEEAARHLVREYDQLSALHEQSLFGIAKNDFAEFLLQVRLLSPLEAIFAYVRNSAEQVHYAETLVDRVEIQLQRLKPFPGGKRSGFVEYCAANPLVVNNGRASRKTRDEVEDYFRRLTHSYLQSYARLLEAAAFDPSVFNHFDRFSKFRRVADDLAALADNDSTALDDCIGRTYREAGFDDRAVDQMMELLRFDLLTAYGFVLAREADQREIDPEIAPHIDRSAKREATCRAQHVLLRAWRMRGIAAPEGGDPADTPYPSKIHKIRRVLEDINHSGIDCVT